MEPGRIKRGLGMDPSHEPALVVGRTYSLAVTALGPTARHTFRVSDPVVEAAMRRTGVSSLQQWGALILLPCTSTGYGLRTLRGRDWSPDPCRIGHSDACVARTGRNRSAAHPEPTRSAPGSTASSCLNVSKTFVATGWVRLRTTGAGGLRAATINFTTRSVIAHSSAQAVNFH
jgi:hypothetical protein